jgi:hypothetical protein
MMITEGKDLIGDALESVKNLAWRSNHIGSNTRIFWLRAFDIQ